jgi:hypothetical protein
MATDEKLHMLTTVDNPFNPFVEFDSWFAFDRDAGYHTPALLARVAVYSEELSESDRNLAIEIAIDEIIQENVLGLHRKVSAP